MEIIKLEKINKRIREKIYLGLCSASFLNSRITLNQKSLSYRHILKDFFPDTYLLYLSMLYVKQNKKQLLKIEVLYKSEIELYERLKEDGLLYFKKAKINKESFVKLIKESNWKTW